MAARSPIDVLIIGSGAGGATTAVTLAGGQQRIVMLEEGASHPLHSYGGNATQGLTKLCRRRGMTPILGASPIGYLEGRCLGGSTEINSGFWHRTPADVLLRWQCEFGLRHASLEDLEPHFCWAERQLHVGTFGAELPKSSQLFAAGARGMGWTAEEVPRAARKCKGNNTCAQGCPTGAKQGMSRSLLPSAKELGVTIVENCRAQYLTLEGRRVTGVVALATFEDGRQQPIHIQAHNVFVCCGPTETPALLRRSRIRDRIGNSLRIHPMLKVIGHFEDVVDAHRTVLPVLQVKDFWPEISIGGAYCTPGHAAMILSENWPVIGDRISGLRHFAAFYVSTRGSGRGTVRPSFLDPLATVIRYELTLQDRRNLSVGLWRLATLLLKAGATAIYPSVQGLPEIRDEAGASRWRDEVLPSAALSLTTVHAFSTCPMGEAQQCATNSFGKVFGYEGLYINDSSLLPDAPGVNPQGTTMALARRNALHFRATRTS